VVLTRLLDAIASSRVRIWAHLAVARLAWDCEKILLASISRTGIAIDGIFRYLRSFPVVLEVSHGTR
jgi:hypothetical protein